MTDRSTPGGLQGELARLEREVARLRDAEERYRALLEHAGDAFFVVDLDGRFVDANRQACEALGYAHRELVGMRVQQLSSRHPPERLRRNVRRLREEGFLTVEDALRRRDGTEFPVEVRLGLLDGGGAPQILALVRDLTDRRRAEDALAQSEDRYRSLVEQTLDGFFVIEAATGRFLFLNQAICDFCGYTIEEGLSLAVWDVIVPEQHDAVRRAFADRLAGAPREPYRTWTLRRRDGSTFTAEISGSATTLEGRAVLQGLLRDVTEREQLLERLRQSQKLEAVGTLASGVAHDFNNILQGISGYVELLLHRRRSDEEQRHYLTQIARASERASELVRGLLAFSRRSEPRPQPLDLNQVISHAAGLLERTLPRRIALETALASNLWPVQGDASQLELVLLNLGTNARDAMGQGGRLILETENELVEPRTADAYPGVAPGPHVVVRVSDEGQGMDRHTLERAFEPFFTTKEVGRGTGLGLSLVYGIVQAHRGFVTCHSVPGRGTTVEIHLPASVQLPCEGEARPRPAPLEGEGEVVLVVDDEEAVLSVVEEFLGDLGYRVVTARSGEEALERHAAAGGAAALAILDLDMAGMGGLECLAALRERDAGLRAVVASGHAGEAHARSAREAGATAFVAKPYRLAELAGLVRDVLRGA